MPSEVGIERQGDLTLLTLQRPEKLNAFNEALVERLLDALERATSDGTRLCVFKGAGKGFSGGFDFGGLEELSDGDLALRFLRLEMLLQAVWSAPFSTLALVHGACYGAAADLVAACSHRVAAPDARFRMPGLRFGVVLGTRRLASLLGADEARSLLESSASFDASRARASGFVQQVAEMAAWPGVIEQAVEAAGALPAAAQRALLVQSRAAQDDRGAGDADLAALARSVAEPGLGQRMRAYLEEVRRRR